jgi:hypothetical protein
VYRPCSPTNAGSISSGRTMKRFPSQCASPIETVRPSTSRADTQALTGIMKIIGNNLPILHARCSFTDYSGPFAVRFTSSPPRTDSPWRCALTFCRPRVSASICFCCRTAFASFATIRVARSLSVAARPALLFQELTQQHRGTWSSAPPDREYYCRSYTSARATPVVSFTPLTIAV